jgi:MFS family permease
MTAHDTSSEELRERPLGDLVKQLAGQTSTLVRQEIDLAKAEMSQKAEIAGKGAGMLSGAAVVGLLAAGALTAFAILLLSEAMDAWLAALIVAVVLGAVAAVLALTGRNRIRTATPPVPEQTVETVKEDVEWAKTRTPSGRT